MSRTEGEKISRQKYESKAYDQILLKVRKGKRAEYKAAADEFGLGQMEMIRLAVEEFIERHGGETVPRPPKPDPLPAADKRLVEEFNQLPVEVKGTIRRLIEQVIALQNMPK